MNQKKILIVDDDKDTLLGLAIRLKANGYQVASAADAVSAISVAKQEAPDLILLDLGLPGGSGFLVMERLRNLISTATIPVIVVSARDPHSNKEQAHKAGALAFFQKPVDNDLLLTAIRKVFGQHAPVGTEEHGS